MEAVDRNKALDMVETENDKYYKQLTNFLKRKDQYAFGIRDEDIYMTGNAWANFILTFICWTLFAASICMSKYVYSTQKLSPWEDIYGRCLVGTGWSYILLFFNDASPFDIPGHIRTKLFTMLASLIIAFLLLMHWIQSLSVLTIGASLLLFYQFSDRYMGFKAIMIILALIGLILLSNPFEILNNTVNQVYPMIMVGISIWLLAFSKYLSGFMKQWLPLSTGCFMFNFITLLIVPAFMIIAFSTNSNHVEYGLFEIGYFLVNGTATWLALWIFAKIVQRDQHNYTEIIGYTIIIYWIVYQVIYKKFDSEVTTNIEVDPVLPTSLDSLGAWEYVGITVMLGLRFLYSLYKLIIFVKSTPKEKEESFDSFNLMSMEE